MTSPAITLISIRNQRDKPTRFQRNRTRLGISTISLCLSKENLRSKDEIRHHLYLIMIYDPLKHWHLLQISIYCFIFVSRRENCVYLLLKDLRDYGMIAVLWFISTVAQRETQMGNICFGFVQEISRVLFTFVFSSVFWKSPIFRVCSHACWIFLTVHLGRFVNKVHLGNAATKS